MIYFPFFQSIAIGFKQINPSSIVVVQAFDPRPCLRIKASENSGTFRRYGFVDAIKELDPIGSLGLLAPDFKVSPFFQLSDFFRLLCFLIVLVCSSLNLVLFCPVHGLISVFQIAYRTAGTRFSGRLSELFLVLSDDHHIPQEPADGAGAFGSEPLGRGQKHRLDDDQMSIESETKQKDQSTSAEKNKSKNKAKNKPKARN